MFSPRKIKGAPAAAQDTILPPPAVRRSQQAGLPQDAIEDEDFEPEFVSEGSGSRIQRQHTGKTSIYEPSSPAAQVEEAPDSRPSTANSITQVPETDAPAQVAGARLQGAPVKEVPLHKMLDKSLRTMVDWVYYEETKHNSKMARDHKLPEWRVHCVPMLASMEFEVLKGIIKGDLALQLHRRNPTLLKLYDNAQGTTAWQHHANGNNPAIYIRVLVNDRGEPLNGLKLQRIAVALAAYLSCQAVHNDLVLKIDNSSNERSTLDDIKKGLHWYLRGRNGARSGPRVAKLREFVVALKANLAKYSEAQLKLPTVPASYVGYSQDASVRISKHDNSDTSWLMSLVGAVCEILFKGEYKFQNFVVAFLVSEEECKFGKALISRMARGYHNEGHGLAVYGAGQNNSSSEMQDMLVSEAKVLWDRAERFRHSVTPFKANMREEMDKLKDELDSFDPTQLEGEELAEWERKLAETAPNLIKFESLLNDERSQVTESERRALGDDLADEFERVIEGLKDQVGLWKQGKWK